MESGFQKVEAVIDVVTWLFLCIFCCPVITCTFHYISTFGCQTYYDLLLCCHFTILDTQVLVVGVICNGRVYLERGTSVQPDSRCSLTTCPVHHTTRMKGEQELTVLADLVT